MENRKALRFQTVICLFIIAIVFFMTFINTSQFQKDYADSDAEKNYIILDSIVERIEYGVNYGKSLDNYYDIDTIFKDLEKYCETDEYFIADINGKRLYGRLVPAWFQDEFVRLSVSDEDYSILTDNKERGILTKIVDGEETIGFAGISYQTSNTGMVDEYIRRMYLFALLDSVIGIVAFLFLFHFVKHEFDTKKLTGMILPLVVALNVLAVGNSYFVLKDGYSAIADEMAEKLIEKNADDIERLIDAGVNYDDIESPEEYFAEITESVAQLESIKLEETTEEDYIVRELMEDSKGAKRYLLAKVSQEYISDSVSSAVLNIALSAVTEVMIASELLIFLVGLIVKPHESRKKKMKADGKISIEHLEVVRGLSFFFAAFRYMSVAFMAVVLAEIYKPIVVFGYEIPYEIVMSFPLSAQVFISMITSYISGAITDKRGWKSVTLFGVIVMSMGTFSSALSVEPVSFIIAQMVVGVGLGFAKMGIDIYAVAVASEVDMSAYTAGSNASIIVGFSSSSLIGALLADTFGYSGAYIAMTVVGAIVFVLIYLFGQDVTQQTAKTEEVLDTTVPKERDLRFGAYILFMIIPYFFIMMFVDYFFPVYAVEQGVTLDEIGYVMLFYGMATAYIGTRICDRLMKKFTPSTLMTVTMLLLAGAIFLFAVKNYVMFAVLIVLLIGIADGIMPSAQFDYLYHLPLSERLGFSKTLGIEGFFSSLIGAVAPVVFSMVMLYGNGGLAVVAVVVCISAFLFAVVNGQKNVKKKSTCILLICCLLVPTLFGSKVYAEENDNNIVIGYCQAESYYEFDYQLYDLMVGMQEREDIVVNADGLHEGSKAHEIWSRLAESVSERYEFPDAGFIDFSSEEYAGLSDDEIAVKIQAIIQENDIDLMLTMGTSAGLMVMNCSDVDYMNFLASDPVGSGIVQDNEYSGMKRGWAHVNSGVDERSMAVMDDLFSPEEIGIVYNFDDPEAYIYSSARSVDEYAKEQNVTVRKVSVSDSIEDTDDAYENYVAEMKAAHQQLADQGIDVYILTTSLLEPEDFNVVLEPLVEKGIPIFSINSTEDVRYGATAAVEMLDYQNIGRFGAKIISDYAEGTKLDALTQKYDTAPFLVLNIDTIHRSGIKLPLDVLLSASSIYKEYTEETS